MLTVVDSTGLELAAARLFAPSAELVQKYSDVVISTADPQDRRIQELIRDYILRNLTPDPKTKRPRRAMVLLFRGEEAVRKVRSVVRDTYGDFILDEHDQVRYFEPAVLAAPTPDEAVAKLKLWSSYSDRDGGVVDNTLVYGPDEKTQRTLVLIKPDNFRFATGRPGNVIDFLSRTGLYIVGIKVHRMSVAEASEFYGPVREVLRTKLKDVVAARAKTVLEKEFGFKIPAAEEKRFGEIMGPYFGDNQFDNIVKFMSGRSPAECDPALARQPGTEKCIALIYEGVEAIAKIRDVLGPTDPSKAPPGSVRREFGSNIMVNAAHASDSVESAQREMKIVNVGENNFRAVVEEVYGKD